jgi:hypothetical protein
MTTRRSFLGSILAAATPPGFVRAGVLMPSGCTNYRMGGYPLVQTMVSFRKNVTFGDLKRLGLIA